jgi:hypothetical protein
MKRVLIAALTTISLVAGVASSRNAAAQYTAVQVFLVVGNFEPDAPPLSLTFGVAEPGRSFGFVTYTDDNYDGIIELPLVPVGSRLALGVDHGDGEVDCDIYDFIGPGVVGHQIVVPLLTNAAVGESVGINFGALMTPPLTLTPGDRFRVENGVLQDWQSLRFVDESGVPDLETFVQVVNTLPAFSGDVVVSDAALNFTFVPSRRA